MFFPPSISILLRRFFSYLSNAVFSSSALSTNSVHNTGKVNEPEKIRSLCDSGNKLYSSQIDGNWEEEQKIGLTSITIKID